MKCYDKYQESKFPWISEVPSHWIEGKIKYLFDIGRGRVISKQELKVDGQFPVYSSQTKNDGCLGYIQTYDFEGDLLTWTTDGVNAGQVFRRSGKFNCTNVCGTLQAKRNNINLGYYLYLLQFFTPFYKRPDTNGAKIMNGEMAEIHTLYPPLEEQINIAEYLDHQTGLIDNIIEKKQQLIEKLKEQRQAIINEAVTKGLDPDAPMKDSGVEWLGEIPENWKSIKLKWLSEIYAGGTPSKNIEKYWENGSIPWLNSGSVNNKRISKPSTYITKEAYDNSSAKWIPKGSLVMALAGQGKTKGTVALLEIDSTCNQSMAAIKLDPIKVCNEFIFYWLESNYYRIRGLAGTEQRDGLNLQIIGNIFCPVPPIEEQVSIANKINTEANKINKLIKMTGDQLGKLIDYRQSIISEAVTGKIDIREWEPKVKESV